MTKARDLGGAFPSKLSRGRVGDSIPQSLSRDAYGRITDPDKRGGDSVMPSEIADESYVMVGACRIHHLRRPRKNKSIQAQQDSIRNSYQLKLQYIFGESACICTLQQIGINIRSNTAIERFIQLAQSVRHPIGRSWLVGLPMALFSLSAPISRLERMVMSAPISPLERFRAYASGEQP